MRSFGWILALSLVATTAHAAEFPDWDAFMKKNRYKCPGPFDTLTKPRIVELAGKTYEHTGYKMTVKDPDADNKVIIGVISAIKDMAPGTKANIAAAMAWFKAEKVEWMVVNGDLALEELDLEDVVDALGVGGFPTLVTLGNSESVGSWGRTYKDRIDKYPNLVNGTWVRQIVADDVEFWPLSGYHDKRFVKQGAGCKYEQEDIDKMRFDLEPSGTAPVVLVSHGPPASKGKKGIDRMFEGKNVGDPMLATLIDKKKIPFGLFGHILEAGGAAVGANLSTPVKPGAWETHLYLNAGSLSGDPWGMNDGTTSYGMAVLFTLEGKKATYEVKRFKRTEE